MPQSEDISGFIGKTGRTDSEYKTTRVRQPPNMAACRLYLSALIVALAAGGAQAGVFGCCTPTQWNAQVRTLQQSVHITSGSTDLKEFLQIINYDGENQRVSVAASTPDNVLIRTVFDYQQMVVYEIVDESVCSRSSLVKPFRSLCLPENVTTVYFAGIGGQLAENTAYFTDNEATGYVTVTLINCALVAEAVYGIHDGDAVSENIQYLNETLSIDAASFWIPPSCPQAEKRRELPNRLGMLGKLLSA